MRLSENKQAMNPNHLQQSVQSIAEVIGLADTEKLVRTLGGTRFKFSKGKQNTARLQLLKKAIGNDWTEKLLAVFGGDEMYIPRCQKKKKKIRNQQFRVEYRQLIEQGLSKARAYVQLLPQYGISNRTADVILQERDEHRSQQGSLL